MAEADRPIWIGGPPIPLSASRGPVLLDDDFVSDVLKVWPEREPVRRLDPTAFDAEFDALADGHCP